MSRIQCQSCALFEDGDWCLAFDEYVPYPRHWRRCRAYRAPRSPAPPLADLWKRLEDEGLAHLVDILEDIGHGKRRLRLKAGIDPHERFRIYNLVGIRVKPTTPIISPDQDHQAAAAYVYHQERAA